MIDCFHSITDVKYFKYPDGKLLSRIYLGNNFTPKLIPWNGLDSYYKESLKWELRWGAEQNSTQKPKVPTVFVAGLGSRRPSERAEKSHGIIHCV